MIEKKSLDYEKTIIVGIVDSNQNYETTTEYLDDLEFLSYTAGGTTTIPSVLWGGSAGILSITATPVDKN